MTKALKIFLIVFLYRYVANGQASDPQTYFGGSNSGAYLDWLNERSCKYEASTFIRSTSEDNEGTAVHWSIDGEWIKLAVAARAEGWVSFGLTQNGGMRGADVVMFSVAKPDQVTDGYVLDDLRPLVDSCQNWKLTHSQVDGGFVIFEAYRLLDTNDTQDIAIINDSVDGVDGHKVISAWGDEETWDYHGASRARDRIVFFDGGAQWDKFWAEMERDAEGSFFIRANEFLIPEEETTYKIFCANASDIMAQGVPLDKELHIIGVEPVIDNRTVRYNHHYVSAGYSSPEITECSRATDASGSLYDWAPGSGPSLLPHDVGIPLGKDGYNSFSLSIHYDNPDHDADKYDSSGLKVHWTSKKRQYNAAQFGLADILTRLDGNLVGEGYTKHVFTCPSSCSEAMLTEPVTVYQETLHMHEAGVRSTNEVVRNGTVVHFSANDFYDFDQSGTVVIQQEPFQVFPGDAFVSTCYFKSDANHTFGFASSEEMCIASFFFYPPLEEGKYPFCPYGIPFLGACNADHLVTQVDGVDGLQRIFGEPGEVCLELVDSSLLADGDGEPCFVESSASTISWMCSAVFFHSVLLLSCFLNWNVGLQRR